MRRQFDFETEPFAASALSGGWREADYEDEGEQPDASFEFDPEAGSFDPELNGEWSPEVTASRPTAVERPGGGRIKDRTPPKPADIVTVTGYGGRRIQLHRLAAAAWRALVSTARSDGIADPLLLIVSGYRNPATQERLWQRALVKYRSAQEARKWVAPPGGSAHQTGRAIDFYLGGRNSSANVGRLRTLPAYKWLTANAQRFGFYPYTREPWHWEYNPPSAGELELYPESDLTLERWDGYEDEGLNLDSATEELEAEAQLAVGWRGEMPQPRQVQARTSGSDAMPQGRYGTLTIAAPERFRFTYAFTPEDVLWTARFIVGEAGGRNDPDNQAVIWAMFNRYAFFTHKYYKTFHSFIRAYSTPLQPSLRSWGAAKRHMHKPEFVRTGGYYAPPHGDIPRGQLQRFLKLQATPWNQLPQSARTLAEQAMRGQVPNPIGNASEFGSTYVYFHDRYRRFPNDEEWRRYTETYARGKGWSWIGPVPGLNQKKNTFFVQKRVASLPPGTVRMVPPGQGGG